MTKLSASFLGAITAGKSAILLIASAIAYACRLAQVSMRAPSHQGADFDFSEDYEQIALSFESHNPDGEKARVSAYVSIQGFVKYEDVNTDALAAPHVAGFTAKDAGVTAAEWKGMSALKKFRTIFRKSEYNGHAVNRKTNKRLSDMILDENGKPIATEDQGPNTQAAMEIAMKVAKKLGYANLEELVGFDPNEDERYAFVSVSNTKYGDKEKTTALVKSSCTADQFNAFVDKYVTA